MKDYSWPALMECGASWFCVLFATRDDLEVPEWLHARDIIETIYS